MAASRCRLCANDCNVGPLFVLKFMFAGNVAAELRNKSPYDFFRYFIDNEIIELMVNETNTYAQQTIENANLSRHSRLRKWKDVPAKEIETYLGVTFWMGLNKISKITDYWSKKLIMCGNKVKSFMSRNRFGLILFIQQPGVSKRRSLIQDSGSN